MDTNLLCSINLSIIGKNNADRSAVNWLHKDEGIPLDRFIRHLNSGYAWSPAIYIGQKRSKATFFKSNIFALDIDAGLTLDAAISKFAKSAALIYTSASHQKQKGDEPPCDRFRIIFVCEQPINSANEYELVLKYLMDKVPECDKACKDCSRFYFGPVPNTDWQHYVFGNVIKQERINAIINEQKKLDIKTTAETAVKKSDFIKPTLFTAQLMIEIDRIKKQLHVFPDHFENEIWTKVAVALVAEFGEEIGNKLINYRWPNNTRYIRSGEFKDITFGTYKYFFNKYMEEIE